jgi:hypothetical protein
LAREKGLWAAICVDYQRPCSLSLAVCQQIDRAEDMCAGLARLEYGSALLRLQHRIAMCHRVGSGIRKLVLRTLRSAYGGRGLRHEQHQQQHR